MRIRGQLLWTSLWKALCLTHTRHQTKENSNELNTRNKASTPYQATTKVAALERELTRKRLQAKAYETEIHGTGQIKMEKGAGSAGTHVTIAMNNVQILQVTSHERGPPRANYYGTKDQRLEAQRLLFQQSCPSLIIE